jgi:hypothetical protein
MRASHLVISLIGTGVFGCGGGSARPDAPPPIDAFVCSQSGLVNTAATPVDFSQGGKKAQGAVPMNGTQLTVSIIVTGSAPDRGFRLLQVNNSGLYSTATGKAGRFEKPPTPGSYPMDPDLNVSAMNVGFALDFVDGITLNSDGSASVRPQQVALLDMTAGGTVQIDSWTPAAAQSGISTIAATITNAKFKGFNVIGSGTVDTAGNGCDITVQKLQFTGLTVQWQAAAFPAIVTPPPEQPAAVAPTMAPMLDGATVLSADFRIE